MMFLFKRTGLLILLLMLFTACQKKAVQETLAPYNPEKDLYLEQEMTLISSYLERAENPGEMEDTLDIEFHYQRAFEELEHLSVTHKEHPTFALMQTRVTESYDSYLTELNASQSDSLSADFIQQQLGDLYDNDSLKASYPLSYTPPRMQIPIEMNSRVEKTIRYFTRGKGKRVFHRWLERTGKYQKLVQDILKEEEAPEELFYLAMIESGFNPRARSWARAVGMWQFISATGKAYGLRNNWWYDERRDPVKATRAAARHLNDLYDRFGDWYLAIAGYNFNPAKIAYRIKKYKVETYWDLPRLPRETRGYVPSFLAAVTIASNPGDYGFTDYELQEPLEFDTMTVRECVDLNVVAKAIGSTFEEMKELNPALLRWCTPPDEKTWTLYIPKGKREIFAQKYAEIPKEKKVSWVRHRIRSGETLSTIARRYNVRMSEIKRFNKLRSNLIRAGKSLVIPIPSDKNVRAKYAKIERKSTPRRTKPLEKVDGREKHEYIVRSGDSLWDISREFNVTLSEIRKWNGLGRTRLIKPGQKLNIWLPIAGAQPSTTASAASKSQTAKKQTSTTSTTKNADGSTITHRVASGETLWDIAQAYKVSIRDIKRWNGKRSNLIHPGDELKILPK